MIRVVFAQCLGRTIAHLEIYFKFSHTPQCPTQRKNNFPNKYTEVHFIAFLTTNAPTLLLCFATWANTLVTIYIYIFRQSQFLRKTTKKPTDMGFQSQLRRFFILSIFPILCNSIFMTYIDLPKYL